MDKTHNKQIVLAMSGGVDSSVACYLLKKEGYTVNGLFMKNWDRYLNYDFKGYINNQNKICDSQKDFNDAKSVAKKLNVDIEYIEFITNYWDKVFKYVIKEYKNGNTPNPDILCNKYIKFGSFLKYAKRHFKTNLIATGHYANVEYKNNQYYLKKALCEEKDQTYFLCWLNQEQLSHIVFPIGKMSKTHVRSLAKKIKLNNWNKKSSSGICFIGERKFNKFLENYIKPKIGNIVNISTNKIIGKHNGIMFYTIGQNKSLGLGGMKEKYYVCKKEIKKNILYVVPEAKKSKYLSSTKCELSHFNWINDYKQWKNQKIQVRFRHRQKLINCNLKICKSKIIIKYKKTLMVTKGQFAVLYSGDFCLGGGIITKVF